MNTKLFIEEVINPVGRELARRKELPTQVFFHCDNASCHRARATRETLEELGLTEMEQPPYSPDIPPSDFFAFEFIKLKMAGSTILTENDLEKRLKQIFQEFMQPLLHSVFQNWMKRLKQTIARKGQYFSTSKEAKAVPFTSTFPETMKV
jgi:hypothetical protein